MDNRTNSIALFEGRLTTGYSAKIAARDLHRTFQAMGFTSAGSGAASIVIQVTNKEVPVEATDVDWLTMGTISLTLGTTQVSDGFAALSKWRWVRAKVASISGTDAEVDVWMGG